MMRIHTRTSLVLLLLLSAAPAFAQTMRFVGPDGKDWNGTFEEGTQRTTHPSAPAPQDPYVQHQQKAADFFNNFQRSVPSPTPMPFNPGSDRTFNPNTGR